LIDSVAALLESVPIIDRQPALRCSRLVAKAAHLLWLRLYPSLFHFKRAEIVNIKKQCWASCLATVFLLALINTSMANVTRHTADPGNFYYSANPSDSGALISALEGVLPEGNLNYFQNNSQEGESMRTFPLTKSVYHPIKVYVQATENPLYKPEYTQYVAESLQNWAEALDNRLRFELVDSPRQANIRVYWVKGFSDPYQAGECEFKPGDATVSIKAANMPGTRIKGNLMHELGHALGISGHSDNNNDIMVGTRNWSSYEKFVHESPKLTENDKLAIRRLYSTAWLPGEDLYQAVKASRIAMTRSARELIRRDHW
jgi:predicted Zn-dependent protease